MRFAVILLTTLIWASPGTADEFCDELKKFEAQVNADSPRPVDEFTELIQTKVNCETMAVSYTKRILVPANQLPEGAQARKQRQHTQLHCNKEGLASVWKWTAMDVMHDVDFVYIFTLTTKPEDCETLRQ